MKLSPSLSNTRSICRSKSFEMLVLVPANVQNNRPEAVRSESGALQQCMHSFIFILKVREETPLN